MKTLVIIPTFNEADNITEMLKAIRGMDTPPDVLVVDDNSPDGTAQFVQKFIESDSHVHILNRSGKQGLGKAYLAGFHWALENHFEWIVQMDADFSHSPSDLQKILKIIRESSSSDRADFYIGSRYVEGGGTRNWGLVRRMISKGGGIYARQILGYPLKDWTGGFCFWSAPVLQKGIDLKRISSNGYSFQIELKYKALKSGYVGKEIPILFEERRSGKSKMSAKIFAEAMYKVWKIRWSH
jgi:dolichol-phosphate mannosyltransferase